MHCSSCLRGTFWLFLCSTHMIRSCPAREGCCSHHSRETMRARLWQDETKATGHCSKKNKKKQKYLRSTGYIIHVSYNAGVLSCRINFSMWLSFHGTLNSFRVAIFPCVKLSRVLPIFGRDETCLRVSSRSLSCYKLQLTNDHSPKRAFTRGNLNST